MNQYRPITVVTAFIDWNSQIHAACALPTASAVELTRHTLSYVGRTIGRVLTGIDNARRFDVTLRLYHGWYQGFEATSRRKAMIQVFAAADFVSLSTRTNVVIRPSLNFGDALTSAITARCFHKLGCNLPNTLRKDINNKDTIVEKMVDTAIASELVDLAHREPHRWLMLIGEDDDLVPPIYVAEGIREEKKGEKGKVLLIRKRKETPFLKLNQLRYAPS
ncbi:hypothetical protein [Acetobacter sp.]|uniref:hypothetical protein n=1 Tax=Acetobacter sp. TaxID=440 RepID=UPI0039EC2D48